jgi:hypothetical protein
MPVNRAIAPQRPFGRCDETASAVSYTSICRSHDVTEFSAPTKVRSMSDERADDLARLLAGDLSGLTHEELVSVARRVETTKDDTLKWSGRVLATLHDVHGLSRGSVVCGRVLLE